MKKRVRDVSLRHAKKKPPEGDFSAVIGVTAFVGVKTAIIIDVTGFIIPVIIRFIRVFDFIKEFTAITAITTSHIVSGFLSVVRTITTIPSTH
jgi:hypothetical protein